eukprot:5009246-Karenia_brevis.AAC.1
MVYECLKDSLEMIQELIRSPKLPESPPEDTRTFPKLPEDPKKSLESCKTCQTLLEIPEIH